MEAGDSMAGACNNSSYIIGSLILFRRKKQHKKKHLRKKISSLCQVRRKRRSEYFLKTMTHPMMPMKIFP